MIRLALFRGLKPPAPSEIQKQELFRSLFTLANIERLPWTPPSTPASIERSPGTPASTPASIERSPGTPIAGVRDGWGTRHDFWKKGSDGCGWLEIVGVLRLRLPRYDCGRLRSG